MRFLVTLAVSVCIWGAILGGLHCASASKHEREPQSWSVTWADDSESEALWACSRDVNGKEGALTCIDMRLLLQTMQENEASAPAQKL